MRLASDSVAANTDLVDGDRSARWLDFVKACHQVFVQTESAGDTPPAAAPPMTSSRVSSRATELPARIGLDPRVVPALARVIDDHGRASLCLGDVAADLRMSRSHLGRLILKETGLTFGGHLRLARMAAAARLLRETPLEIKEISRQTGYSHVPSFYRQFIAHFQTTPSEFRRAHTR